MEMTLDENLEIAKNASSSVLSLDKNKFNNNSVKLRNGGTISEKSLSKYDKSSSLLARTVKNLELSDDSMSSKHNEILEERKKVKKHMNTYAGFENEANPGYGVDIQSNEADNSKVPNSADNSLAVINEVSAVSNVSCCADEDQLP